jgi:hypothetical protein
MAFMASTWTVARPIGVTLAPAHPGHQRALQIAVIVLTHITLDKLAFEHLPIGAITGRPDIRRPKPSAAVDMVLAFIMRSVLNTECVTPRRGRPPRRGGRRHWWCAPKADFMRSPKTKPMPG